jgi:hypothetical protein
MPTDLDTLTPSRLAVRQKILTILTEYYTKNQGLTTRELTEKIYGDQDMKHYVIVNEELNNLRRDKEIDRAGKIPFVWFRM